MKLFTRFKSLSWLPQLKAQVWILAAGRFLSGVGSGFTLFYAPIFFVNKVGLSATQVGLGLGSASVSGVLGRILGGSFSDSKVWGRRRTLLLSAAICTIASLVLAVTNNFSIFVIGNLLTGLGTGIYWPATEAVVADLTEGEARKEAYAITRLADNLGLGLGIIFGGILIGATGAYRTLFVMDAISFAVFFGVVYFAIAETGDWGFVSGDREKSKISTGKRGKVKTQKFMLLPVSWRTALSDRRMLVFVVANVIFTTYISQLYSTISLYFSSRFSPQIISGLFSWHMIVAIVSLIPIVRLLRRFSHPQALTVSALFWAIGFSLIWLVGVAPSTQLAWAISGMVIFAIATVCYTPSASSFVADIAPPSLRGVYLSINSLCWAIGGAIGPPLGGWAMDRSPLVANNFWLCLAFSVGINIAILQYLNRILANKQT